MHVFNIKVSLLLTSVNIILSVKLLAFTGIEGLGKLTKIKETKIVELVWASKSTRRCGKIAHKM